MITNRTSAIILATLLSVAAVLWVSAPGKAKEAGAAPACIGVTWPTIPAACLLGASDRPVRGVSADRSPFPEMGQRFTAAFE